MTSTPNNSAVVPVTSSVGPTVQIKQEPPDIVEDFATLAKLRPPTQIYSAYPFIPMPHRNRHRYPIIKPSGSPDTSVCEVCQAEFSSQALLQTHKLCHFNTSHVCYVCDTYFMHADTMILHMATTHRNLNPACLESHSHELFICCVCLQKFSSKTTLVNHQNNHSTKDMKNFMCRVCGLDFIGARALMAHLSSPRHSEMKVKIQSIFVCVDCRSIFASRDSYAMHMMLRAQNESCKGLETGEVDLQTASNVAAITASLSGFSDGSTKLDCGISLRTVEELGLGSPLNLSKATGSHAVSDVCGSRMMEYSCTKCSQKLPSQDALALHMMLHVRGDLQCSSAPEQRSFPPPQEDPQNRPNSAPAPSHLSATGGPSPWVCSKCSVTFDSCTLLAMHMMTRHSSKERADVKDASSSGVENKRNDAVLNSEEQEITRSSSVNSKTPSNPNYYCSTHNSPSEFVMIRPMSADYGKRTLSPDSAELQLAAKHRRMSADSMQCWPCEHCKITFSSKASCQEHVKRQHINKDMAKNGTSCKCCGMTFLDSRALNIHMRTSQRHVEETEKALSQRMLNIGWIPKEGHLRQSQEESVANHAHTTDVPPTDKQEHFQSDHPGKRHVQQDISHGDKDLSQQPLNLMCGSRNTNNVEVMDHSGTISQSQAEAELAQTARRNRRKGRIVTRARTTTQSPEPSDSDWNNFISNHIPMSPGATAGSVSQSGLSPGDDQGDSEALDYVLSHAKDLAMCKYCNIVYTDRTVYFLHMGLHNLNDPWQCNMCGKKCRDLHEFSSHVIHY